MGQLYHKHSYIYRISLLLILNLTALPLSGEIIMIFYTHACDIANYNIPYVQIIHPLNLLVSPPILLSTGNQSLMISSTSI